MPTSFEPSVISSTEAGPRRFPSTIPPMRWVVGLALVVTLVSCSGDPPAARPEPSTPTTQAPTETPSSPAPSEVACADEAATGERLPGALEGDVDGDGTVDEIFLVRSDPSSAECALLLVVRGSAATYAVSTQDPAGPYSMTEPRLNGIAEIDDDPGVEVLVDVEAGASTQFLGMFTIDDGELVRVRVGGDSGLGDLFPYGGSVGHIEAANCVADDESADVVIAVATPRGSRYLVERTFYSFEDGGTLTEVNRDEERVPVEALSQDNDYVTSPFGSCASNP